MVPFRMITAMVESPKGYNQKFDYDPEAQRFKFSKVLPAGLVFPFDFGMIPGTKGEDGDRWISLSFRKAAPFRIAWWIAASLARSRPSRRSGTVKRFGMTVSSACRACPSCSRR